MACLPAPIEQIIRKARLRSKSLAKTQQNLDPLCVAMQIMGMDAELVSFMLEVKIQTVERNAHYKTLLLAIRHEGQLYSLNSKGWRDIGLEYTHPQYAEVFAQQIQLSMVGDPAATRPRTTPEEARILLSHVEHAQLASQTPKATPRRPGARL